MYIYIYINEYVLHFAYCFNLKIFLFECVLQWNLPISDIPNSGQAINSGQNI